MHRIPSWCVAVLAAFIVIVASLLSWTTIRKVEAEIAAARTEVAAMLRTTDSSWNSHLQADQRSSAAAMFLAQVGGNPNTQFLLDQAASHLRGATMSMWAASGQDVADETPANVARLEQKLRSGDLSAYAEFTSELDRLRLLSATHISELGKSIDRRRLDIDSMESEESDTYRTYFFLSLLGLVVAMCKDLPVWNDAQALRESRSTHSPNL